MSLFLDGSIGIWGFFGILVLCLLVFDLGFLNKKHEHMSIQKNIRLSIFYIIIGVSFSLWIYYLKGSQGAQEYLTGYLVEKSLSLDNIFMFSLIFGAFSVPLKYQHRVLFWGIIGVLILRGIMIGFGSVLIQKFEWVTYVFAAFLVFTGVKMLLMSETPPSIHENALFRFLSSHLRITPTLYGEKFIVFLKDDMGKKTLWVTPLFIALVLIEASDVVFAIDSVPAIFSITKDPYIVYTSNIFAILGLRSLYFALSNLLVRFVYLKHALALILIFIGAKVLVAWGLSIDKIPSIISLSVTLLLLAGGVITSLFFKKEESL